MVGSVLGVGFISHGRSLVAVCRALMVGTLGAWCVCVLRGANRLRSKGASETSMVGSVPIVESTSRGLSLELREVLIVRSADANNGVNMQKDWAWNQGHLGKIAKEGCAFAVRCTNRGAIFICYLAGLMDILPVARFVGAKKRNLNMRMPNDCVYV